MKINFFGDFVIQNQLPTIGSRLYELISSSEYNVVNFEAPIHTKSQMAHKSGPCISQNVDSPKWLIDEGFNLISLANNHIFDF